MATEQPLTPTVLDQNDDPMSEEDVTYTSDDEEIATVTSDGLVEAVAEGETFIRVASVTDPDVYSDVPVTVNAETPGPTSAVLTSVPNGFRRGLNFSDSGITNGTTARAAMLAIFGGAIPDAGKWTVITDDPTYGKILRLTPPPGDFAMYLAGVTSTLVSNARVRTIIRFNGYATADLDTRAHLKLQNYVASRSISVETETGGDMSMKTVNTGVSSLTTVTSSGTTLRNALVDGGWKELILECKDNGNSTITNTYVQVTPGSTRTPVLTRTSSSGDYPGLNSLQFDGFEILSPYLTSTGATIDFALIESCNPFDGSGNLVSLSALGT